MLIALLSIPNSSRRRPEKISISCSARCHGPSEQKLGAPSLRRQQPAYLERQLVSFAQGIRQNDINLQMRTIATQLTPDEMHAIAAFYGVEGAVRTSEK
jgi:cytochrome c553